MSISTKYHGEMEVAQEEIWHFDSGIPGFLNEKTFVLLPLEDNPLFQILQSTENKNLAFVLTNPFYFNKNYDFKIDEGTLEQLSLQNEKDVAAMVIVTVKDPFEKSTANLQAPVIFNLSNQKAKQMILTQTEYKTREFIFQQLPASKG
ncbi:flagellar assembly protein FliW [Falsibacillus pallidus]|uniref:Flagellar assembly factor FliW n=1 Tax=Falsibacillus pallidus TaxID=493781 RepID=A0A370G8M7_9BACI|nr:flagellar assembly protein FliW [Falsibacillus pallidus]RDI40117.1 flagellar assembly factor FliW [Falsibacillus pallidus]